MEIITSFNFQIVFQTILAVILGAFIGIEREIKKKGAGIQTYSLVSLGSCIFTLISFELFNNFIGINNINFDPSRIVQAVAVGIGFLGAGVIFQRPSRIEGLTTAAGLWGSISYRYSCRSPTLFFSYIYHLTGFFNSVWFWFLGKKIFK